MQPSSRHASEPSRRRRRTTRVAVLAAMLAIALTAPAAAADDTGAALPNQYGQAGVVRTTNAKPRPHLSLGATTQGFVTYYPDFLVDGAADANALVGANVAGGVGLFDLFEFAVATRAASNANSARGASAFSLGDLYPSFKTGVAIAPVAFGLDVRAHLPTRFDAAGVDFTNSAFTGQGLFSLDLTGSGVPLRAHLGGGYTFQLGKVAAGIAAGQGTFEDNPNFYDGIDGALLALATQQWFYDQAIAGLSLEVPLPFVTPFVEAWYQAAIGVPDNRGKNTGAYDFLNDAHVIVTPGARVRLGNAVALDLGADIGLTGNGGFAAPALAQVVEGTPLNPLWLARVGLTLQLDPNAAAAARPARAPDTGQLRGCVVDQSGQPVPGAVAEGAVLLGARLVTDESGCFTTPPLAVGEVQVLVSHPLASQKLPIGGVLAAGEVTQAQLKLALVATAKPVAATNGGAAAPGHVVGFVTNKDDVAIDADLELWDARGPTPAGKTAAGAFDVEVAAGTSILVARADGYLALGTEVHVDAGGRELATIALKKAPKKRSVALEKDQISKATKVPFESKRARLQNTAEFLLDEVVDVLLQNPKLRVRVEVYSEPAAVEAESQKLADDRAAAVADYLIKHGVWPARLETKGVPLPAGEADKGRRTEFIVIP
ncbi:MAG: OmpA family protein [Deltaproteobacteria bacterium]|nr:OmpA family protein [Deltaproteobacteria bacterium]